VGAEVAEAAPADGGGTAALPTGRLGPAAEGSGGGVACAADDDLGQQQLPMSAGAGGEWGTAGDTGASRSLARAPGKRTRSEPGRFSGCAVGCAGEPFPGAREGWL
jgi:hypothetical protein